MESNYTITMYKHLTPQEIEEFERSFNSKHGSNHHAFANDGKRPSNCDVCIEDKKYNPKGYYLTFLSERNCYWTRSMMDDVLSFIDTLIGKREQDLLERYNHFLLRHGYVDSDIWAEEPTAIDRFLSPDSPKRNEE